MNQLAPHQQRVVDEKAELDERREKLSAFYSTPIFHGLAESEQSRLLRQGVAMRTYSEILGERIEAFGVAPVTLPVIDPGPDSLEREIQAKASTGPRVTPSAIEAEIASEHYFTAEQGAFAAFDPPRGSDVAPPELSLLTFCVLVLKNGFTVTGESACASPENFNAEIGRKIARQKAIDKVWPLLGFRLRDALSA